MIFYPKSITHCWSQILLPEIYHSLLVTDTFTRNLSLIVGHRYFYPKSITHCWSQILLPEIYHSLLVRDTFTVVSPHQNMLFHCVCAGFEMLTISNDRDLRSKLDYIQISVCARNLSFLLDADSYLNVYRCWVLIERPALDYVTT